MINLVLLFGGKSAEHEVSVRSAQSIYSAIDHLKYSVKLLGISRLGNWKEYSPEEFINIPLNTALKESDQSISPIELLKNTDVVFSILHGPNGEDGAMQGFLKTLDLPFVGPSILGSAICMDKDVMKRLLDQAKIPIVKFLVYRLDQKNEISFDLIKEKLGLPVYVKPSNMGSSVGVKKAESKIELISAVETAFRYDTKILIEEAAFGREIECSVLGNQYPKAASVGEISTSDSLYDYEKKYISDDGARLTIPAELSPELESKVKQIAIAAYQVLCCEGMARVDMFLKPDGTILVNELNTLPGFTSISMYPKLWENAGLSYQNLIDSLINLAIERKKQEQQLLMK